MDQYLFSYGTLQDESVQLSTFGRKLNGSRDALAGYRLQMIRIEDQDFVTSSGAEYHRNLVFTGATSDVVEGTLFAVTQKELELADTYEPEGYARIRVVLNSAINAWVYLKR